MPSSREGWGISVTEAAACGTPSVGYDVVGLRDSIKNEITGILVPLGDVDALANAIMNILKNDDFREELNKNALEYAREFSWDKSAKEILKIIESFKCSQ